MIACSVEKTPGKLSSIFTIRVPMEQGSKV